jgi:hypothetical protein
MRLHRPPAVPLVTIDPHTNVWSAADRLTDDWPRHWTGSKMALYGVVRVDGVAYRFMGGREWLANAAEQVALTIDATKTRYAFRCGPIELGVVFVSPMLVDDLLSRTGDLSHDLGPGARRRGAPDFGVRRHDRRVGGEPAARAGHLRAARGARGQGGDLPVRIAAHPAGGGDHRRIEWGTAFLAGRAGAVETIIGDIDNAATSSPSRDA